MPCWHCSACRPLLLASECDLNWVPSSFPKSFPEKLFPWLPAGFLCPGHPAEEVCRISWKRCPDVVSSPRSSPWSCALSRKFPHKALAGDVAFPIWGQVCGVSCLLINQNTSEREHSHQILFILCFNYQHSPWHIFSSQQPTPTQTIPMLGLGDHSKNNSYQALWATLFWRMGQNLAVNRIRLGLAADFWAQGPDLC